VYWLAVALGVALLVVLATWGSFPRLLGLRLQSVWLLVAGLGAQIALELFDFSAPRRDDVGFGILMASYALILAFCFVNLPVRGMAVVTVGFAMNALVIGLNEGMPTRDHAAETASGREVERPVDRTVKERPESDEDLLPFLGQIVPLPDNRVDAALSFGDLVIAVGVVNVCFQGSRRRRPARSADVVSQDAVWQDEERADLTVADPAEPPAIDWRAPVVTPAAPTHAAPVDTREQWLAELRALAGDVESGTDRSA
jgi:hypothetical protein